MHLLRSTALGTLLILSAAALAACSSMNGGDKPMGGSTTMRSSSNVPMVGGAPMYPNKDIIENAVNSKDHTTLVAAIKAADLVDTLKGPGLFTVFAPTNEAFAALPAGSIDTLLEPESKARLVKILTYHVVAGRIDSANFMQTLEVGGGRTFLTTISGGILMVTMPGGKMTVTDENGGVAHVTIADVTQSNGVIYVVDKVLLPR